MPAGANVVAHVQHVGGNGPEAFQVYVAARAARGAGSADPARFLQQQLEKAGRRVRAPGVSVALNSRRAVDRRPEDAELSGHERVSHRPRRHAYSHSQRARRPLRRLADFQKPALCCQFRIESLPSVACAAKLEPGKYRWLLMLPILNRVNTVGFLCWHFVMYS